MDKFNSLSCILFVIALSSSIGFHSALPFLSGHSPNTTETSATHHRAKSILSLVKAHNQEAAGAAPILSPNDDSLSNGTSKVNSSASTNLAQPVGDRGDRRSERVRTAIDDPES